MSKKNFKGGFDSLLGGVEHAKSSSDIHNTDKTLKKTEIRATFIVDLEKIELMKSISFWQRKKIKKVVDEAFSAYIEAYIAKNGQIKKPEEAD